MSDIPIRYRWRRTWPDQDQDFVGEDGSLTIGRFYWAVGTEGEMCWFWFLQGLMFNEPAPNGRCVGPARAVAAMIEDLHDELLPTAVGVLLPSAAEVTYFQARGLLLPEQVLQRRALVHARRRFA